MSNCRSCNAPIVWATHEHTGKAAPIDAEPDDTGNIVMENGEYRLIPVEDQDAHTGRLHLNHFATCPDAKTAWK